MANKQNDINALNSSDLRTLSDAVYSLYEHHPNKAENLIKILHKVNSQNPHYIAAINWYSSQVNSATWQIINPRLQICENPKFFFIHIPKCGGTSVDESNLFETKRAGHSGYQKFKSILATKTFMSYKCFTFARNPWDRLASAFYYISEGGAGTKVDLMQNNSYIKQFNGNLRLFLEDFTCNPNKYLKLLHFKKMIDFVDPESVEIPLFIQKLESVQDLHALNSFLGAELSLPHIRKRKSYHNASKAYSTELFERVRSIYREDVARFGYNDYNLNSINN